MCDRGARPAGRCRCGPGAGFIAGAREEVRVRRQFARTRRKACGKRDEEKESSDGENMRRGLDESVEARGGSRTKDGGRRSNCASVSASAISEDGRRRIALGRKEEVDASFFDAGYWDGYTDDCARLLLEAARAGEMLDIVNERVDTLREQKLVRSSVA